VWSGVPASNRQPSRTGSVRPLECGDSSPLSISPVAICHCPAGCLPFLKGQKKAMTTHRTPERLVAEQHVEYLVLHAGNQWRDYGASLPVVSTALTHLLDRIHRGQTRPDTLGPPLVSLPAAVLHRQSVWSRLPWSRLPAGRVSGPDSPASVREARVPDTPIQS